MPFSRLVSSPLLALALFLLATVLPGGAMAAVPTIDISGPGDVSEFNSGTSPVDFTITLSAPYASEVLVSVQTAEDRCAVAGSDYIANSAVLRFLPGEVTKTFTVLVIGDAYLEADQYVTVEFSTQTAGFAGQTGQHSTRIRDDEADVKFDDPSVILPTGTASVGYSQKLSASGGYGALLYFPVTGVPDGLKLSAAGVLSGTPTKAGVFDIEVQALDSSPGDPCGTPGSTAIRYYELTIEATFDYPEGSLHGQVGQAYSQQLTALGLTNPTYSERLGASPPGIGVSAGGLVSGTPTQAGDYTFWIVATESDGKNGTSREFGMTIESPMIVLDSAGALPNATTGVPYSRTITATGSVAPYTFSLEGGALPAGLTLSPAGVLGGTPSVAGNFAFEIGALDATRYGYSGSQQYTLTVASVMLPTVSVFGDVKQSEGNAGATTVTFTAILSKPSLQTVTVAYAVSNGTAIAPADYGFNQGTLSFSPGADSRMITVQVNGDVYFEADETVLVTLSSPSGAELGKAVAQATIVNDDVPTSLSPVTLPAGAIALPYNQTLTASPGVGAFTFSVAAGNLPPGLTLGAQGILSGSPTQAGVYAFTIKADDSLSPAAGGPNTASRAYSMTMAAPSISFNPGTLPSGTVAAAYSQLIAASGGKLPYSYAATAGALPAGLSLSPNGSLSGTPTAAGPFNFTITATDVNGATGALAYSLTIAAQPVIASPPPVKSRPTSGKPTKPSR